MIELFDVAELELLFIVAAFCRAVLTLSPSIYPNNEDYSEKADRAEEEARVKGGRDTIIQCNHWTQRPVGRRAQPCTTHS